MREALVHWMPNSVERWRDSLREVLKSIQDRDGEVSEFQSRMPLDDPARITVAWRQRNSTPEQAADSIPEIYSDLKGKMGIQEARVAWERDPTGGQSVMAVDGFLRVKEGE